MHKLPDRMEWRGANLDFSHGAILMGILNVTPDSFSDGGLYQDVEAAVTHGIEMEGQGASIIDIGAESTRPGSRPVSAVEQIHRAIPVIERLVGKVKIPISIDTTEAEVALAAIEAGASIINDITALASEKMAALAAQKQVPVILMHMQGTPETMQQAPVYKNVVADVRDYLLKRAELAENAGVLHERIILDPGIGFGKTFRHNLQLLNQLDRLCELDYRILIGTSRKGFLGKITETEKVMERDWATAASVAMAIAKGASIVRVHNVRAMADAVAVANAVSHPERCD